MIGENIRILREQRNMSKEDLAMKARIGKQKLVNYEEGKQTPDLQTILKISTALDCPASELVECLTSTGPSGLDPELLNLINQMGHKKAKMILKNTKDVDEKDFLQVMNKLHDLNKTNYPIY